MTRCGLRFFGPIVLLLLCPMPSRAQSDWARPNAAIIAETAGVGLGTAVAFSRIRGGFQSVGQGVEVLLTGWSASLLLASAATDRGREDEVAGAAAVWGAAGFVAGGLVTGLFFEDREDSGLWGFAAGGLMGFAAGALIGGITEIAGEDPASGDQGSIPVPGIPFAVTIPVR